MVQRYRAVETAAADAAAAHLIALSNGRRPQFDLYSVFGDGPGLAAIGTPNADVTQSQAVTPKIAPCASGRAEVDRP